MYIVKKDGLYLMNYINAGIHEMDSDGVYKDMLTGIYSPDIKDAMLIESKLIAERLGGEMIKVKEGKK